MKRFIDRVSEWNTLEEEYNRTGASFVVVYGRRRVGKSTLLSKFCEGKKSIFYLATEENERQNIESFQNQIAETFESSIIKNARFDRWEAIFEALVNLTDDEKKLILVIDEFQYLGMCNAAFPSILMKIWETTLKEANIMLVLCGSLIRMMTSQVLNYDSPLYGRRTAQIRMQQIPFAFYKEFMPQLNVDEQLKSQIEILRKKINPI